MYIAVETISVQKGLYTLLVSPFDSQISKLWQSGVAKQS